jgi:hypothetical protein
MKGRRARGAMNARMNKPATQELLPPVSEGPTGPSGWVHWLLDPLPQRFLLPATGLLMLGLDWLLFPKEAATVGLATPVTAILGFLLGGIGTYHLQRRYGLNARPAAIFKALLAGFFVGVPFPLAGTLVGGWVLATSGLADLKRRLLKERLFRR